MYNWPKNVTEMEMSLAASNIAKMKTSCAVSNENFDQNDIVSIPMVYANLCDTIFLVICQESFCTRNHGNKNNEI